MAIDNNLYEKSIKILTDLIAFRTVSGTDNSDLINYCEKTLNDLGIKTFKVFDDEEKRMAKIFDIYELILIRPDRYVYGGIKSMQETSNIVEELEKTFSLKI